MDSTTDTASGIAIVMKDKKNHGMKNKNKRIFNKPSNITHTRTHYGIKQVHNLKKVYIWNNVKITFIQLKSNPLNPDYREY